MTASAGNRERLLKLAREHAEAEAMQHMPKVGMGLIAKDEAENIEPCFESWWDDVDHVVLVDTGSTDNTIAEARAFAAEKGEPDKLTVDEFEWVDDFSAARQRSWDLLAQTDCTHYVWCDLDDRLVGAANLRAVAANAPGNIVAWVMPYSYAHDAHGNVTCTLERERLIRADVRQVWRLPVHEVLEVDGQLGRSDAVRWVHRKTPESVEPGRNYRILRKDLESSETRGEPPSSRTLIYLGTECMALNKPGEAIGYLERYLESTDTPDEERCQGAHKLSIAYRMLADQTPAEAPVLLAKAGDAARRAIDERPDWADGYLDLAELSIRAEQWERALRYLGIVKGCGQPQTLLIINPLDYTYQPLVMESVCLIKLGRAEEALAITDHLLSVTPGRDDLAQQRQNIADEVQARETITATLRLRELLLRHDEADKANRLMECVPYYVTDHPAIAQARLDTREMTLHATEPELYERFYRSPEIEAKFEDAHPHLKVSDAPDIFPRVEFVAAQLAEMQQGRKRKLRVLDGSMNDGWIAAYLADQGYRVDGCDMNPEAVKSARARKPEHPNLGTLVCDDIHNIGGHFEDHSFDAVVCLETIEHVPNPEHLLDVLARMVRKGGRLIVSTPDGAFERGRDPVMSEWHKVEPKGHLRAIRIDDLTGWMCERGVIEDAQILPDRTIAVAMRPAERKGKVVFFAGEVDALPERIISDGMGGSETALCKMAESFARRGYDVRVYAGTYGQCVGGLRGDQITVGVGGALRGQVLYSPASAWNPGDPCDLFVCSRIPEVFDRTINAKHSALWLHDAEYGGRLTPERAERVDSIIVLSQWQREKFIHDFPFVPSDKWFLSRNGIETRWFRRHTPAKDRKPICVYSSSPDRGLDVLLECWPAVRARVPDAELHHTYAPVYAQFRSAYPHLQAFHAKIDKLHEGLEGVVRHDHLGQKALAELYASARCWPYPSYTGWSHQKFPEISCLSGDTLIDMPRNHRTHPDGVPIQELAGRSNFPVWAWDADAGRFVIATAKWCAKTKRDAETITIDFEEGTEITVTPDHKVLTYDGEWVEAGTLSPGDRLRGLHYKYNVAVNCGDGRWTDEHRKVGEWMEGRPLNGHHEHVHHLDDRRLDNRPESLEVLSASEHHSMTHKGKRVSDASRTRMSKSQAKRAQTPEGKAHQRSNASKAGRSLWDRINALPPEERAAWIAERNRRKVASEKANREAMTPEEQKAYRDSMRERGRAGAESFKAKLAVMPENELTAYREKKREVALRNSPWTEGDVSTGNHRVKAVRPGPRVDVYDMEVEGLHNFVAGGVVVHNCITGVEAQAAGTIPVTQAYAALKENVVSGELIEGDPASDEWRAEFVDGIVRALTDDAWLDAEGRKGRKFALDLSWEGVADHWEQAFLLPAPVTLEAVAA